LGIVLAAFLFIPGGAALAQISPSAPPIQDNSFLVEEAYNQNFGVVQHISSFVSAPAELMTESLHRQPSELSFKSDEDWLCFQVNSPHLFHSVLNSILEGENISRSSSATVDDGKRVFAGDADAA
jgi:hypothetical protein